MSKRRTKAEEIKSPENYFNRYIALEVRKDRKKDQKYYALDLSLEKVFAESNVGITGKKGVLLAVNLKDEEFEKYVFESSVFGWIEMIENEALSAAVTQLSEKEKLFLTLRYQYGLSQPEIAQLMGVTQQAASKYESKILKK